MKPEIRQKYLESLARSKQGEALLELLEEKIEELKDVTKLPAEHFEVQGRANIMAIIKIKEIIKTLNLLGKEKVKRNQNPYI